MTNNPAMEVEMSTVTESTEKPFKVNASIRCDRCGAQAWVNVLFDAGYELYFCKHHYAENKEKLQKIALAIYDESDDIK